MNQLIFLNVIYMAGVRLLGHSIARINLCLVFTDLLVLSWLVNGGKQKVRFLAAVFMINAVSSFLAAVSGMEEVNAWAVQTADGFCGIEDRFRYGKRTHADAVMGTGKKTETVRLLVSMSVPAKLYLKDFSGMVFEDGRWKEKRPEEEDRLLEEYLAKRRFYPETQLTESLLERGFEDHLRQTEVKIENLSAGRKYWHIPALLLYGEDPKIAGSRGSLTHSRTPGFSGQESYAYTACFSEDPDALTDAVLESSGGQTSEEERLYRAYVYETCLLLPEDLGKETAGIDLAKIGGSSPPEVAASVKRGVSGIEDPFERASKAVLLFRYAGMPARYAEGYAADGRAYDAGEEIPVTDKDLTAWAEIYLDGIGFVPVLPGSDGGAPEETFDPAPASLDLQTDAGREGTGGPAKQEAGRSLLFLFLLLPGIFLLACFRRRKRRGRKKRKDPENISADFPVSLCVSLKNMLECQGVHVDFRDPYRYSGLVEKRLGKEMRIYYENILRISDGVRFGEERKGYGRNGNERKEVSFCAGSRHTFKLPAGRVRKTEKTGKGRSGKNGGREDLYRV